MGSFVEACRVLNDHPMTVSTTAIELAFRQTEIRLRADADADHGQLPGKSVGAISTSRYLPFVHGLDVSTASDPHAPIFIAPAKLLSFKFALYPDRT